MINKPVRFEQDTLDRLKQLATIEDREEAYLIRQAVNEMLEAHEWQVQQSMETLKKIDSGDMQTFSHSEARSRLKKKGLLP